MTTSTSPTATEELLAFSRVRRIKGFYVHLAQYLLTSAALFAINVLWWYPRHLWSLWIIVGWGSGVLVHGLKTFDRIPFLTADWEKRQVEHYLGRKL